MLRMLNTFPSLETLKKPLKHPYENVQPPCKPFLVKFCFFNQCIAPLQLEKSIANDSWAQGYMFIFVPCFFLHFLFNKEIEFSFLKHTSNSISWHFLFWGIFCCCWKFTVYGFWLNFEQFPALTLILLYVFSHFFHLRRHYVVLATFRCFFCFCQDLFFVS